MNVKFGKRVAIGATAATALGLVFAPAAAFAAPLDNGSEFPIYLVDADSETTIAGQTLQWDSVVSAVSNLASPYDRFPASPDATGVKLFISAPGDEYTQAQWYGVSEGALDRDTKTNGLSYMPLDYFQDGDRAGDVSDVKANGGTYSLGFVYTNENGNQIAGGKGAWFRIQVTAGSGQWTFTEPVAASSAPAITTQPANASVNVGADATFTAAASGTPAPTVKWESSTNGTNWSDVAGATSATLTVSGATVAQSGTQYRAVFTNTAGSATSGAATLTVARVAPDQPSGSAPGKVDIAAPAQGETKVTVSAGIANANKTLNAWAWSTPTNLGQVTTDANGNAQVDTASLPDGRHTIALAESDFTVVAWGTVDVANGAEGSPAEVELDVNVTATNKFALAGTPASISFGDVRRGQSVMKPLGAITVTDDRVSLKGWTLTTAVSDFTGTEGTIAKSALAIASKKVDGDVAGITLGSGSTIAEGVADSMTGVDGTKFDADLTFTAPKEAKVGAYTSTLTLTLASK